MKKWKLPFETAERSGGTVAKKLRVPQGYTKLLIIQWENISEEEFQTDNIQSWKPITKLVARLRHQWMKTHLNIHDVVIEETWTIAAFDWTFSLCLSVCVSICLFWWISRQIPFKDGRGRSLLVIVFYIQPLRVYFIPPLPHIYVNLRRSNKRQHKTHASPNLNHASGTIPPLHSEKPKSTRASHNLITFKST